MVECPQCLGRPSKRDRSPYQTTAGYTNGRPYQRQSQPCHLCGGDGRVTLHKAVIWAHQHPGSAAWRRLILPVLTIGGTRPWRRRSGGRG